MNSKTPSLPKGLRRARAITSAAVFAALVLCLQAAHAQSFVPNGSMSPFVWSPDQGKWENGLSDGYAEADTVSAAVKIDAGLSGGPTQYRIDVCFEVHAAPFSDSYAFTAFEDWDTSLTPPYLPPNNPISARGPMTDAAFLAGLSESGPIAMHNATIVSVSAASIGHCGPGFENYLGLTVIFTIDDPAECSYLLCGGHLAEPGDLLPAGVATGDSAVPDGQGASTMNGTFQMRIQSSGEKTINFKAPAALPDPGCRIQGPGTVCASDMASFSSLLTEVENPSYEWSIVPGAQMVGASIAGSSTGSTVDVKTGSPGTFQLMLAVTDGNSGQVGKCSLEISVVEPPPCSITFTPDPAATPFHFCPGPGDLVFSGPAGAGLAYEWEVFGASASSPLDGQSLTVAAPSTCDGSFIVRLTVSESHVEGQTCSATCAEEVTVGDGTAPVFDGGAPGNQTVPNDEGECGAVVMWTDPTATDNCDESPSVICVPPSGSFFPVGKTTVVCTATDACGNALEHRFDVTVQDREPPVITCPQNIVTGNDSGECGAVVTWNGPTASDNCTAPGEISIGCDRQSGSFFTVGHHVVTCTARDAAGNQVSCSFGVTVNDTEPPSIVCGPLKMIQCNEEPTFDEPMVSDNCSVAGVTMGPVEEGEFMGRETFTKTWTAMDPAENKASCSQTIIRNFCPVEFCSLTQGYYGNKGGKFNGKGTPEILGQLLGSDPEESCGFGNLVLGKPGRSITITKDDVQKFFTILPGGGPSAQLPLGNYGLGLADCRTLKVKGFLHKKTGRISNVLAAQTITLMLNVRLDGCLADLDLAGDELINEEHCFYTQRVLPGDDGVLGTGLCRCDAESIENLDDVIDAGDTPRKYRIPAGVIAALGAAGDTTVAGLVELANCALASQLPGGVQVDLDALNAAVSAINEAFDECRVLIDYVQMDYMPEPAP